uniref:G_PROTEIN_RECEP_F1_2 domain-containing protein n=1 Tax=Heterorhabditis bacteriophora TaxID=37862 RepID=A0A1I7X7W6_HETBA
MKSSRYRLIQNNKALCIKYTVTLYIPTMAILLYFMTKAHLQLKNVSNNKNLLCVIFKLLFHFPMINLFIVIVYSAIYWSIRKSIFSASLYPAITVNIAMSANIFISSCLKFDKKEIRIDKEKEDECFLDLFFNNVISHNENEQGTIDMI